MESLRLSQDFFARDTITVARELLGKLIIRRIGRNELSARIVETEAYLADDPACHAYSSMQKLRKGIAPSGRSAVLFGEPGCAYVYLNYGMYWLFNVVTERSGTPGAVLIRAVEPVMGVTTMQRSRPHIVKPHELTNGPGKLALALGIGPEFNGRPLYEASNKELFFACDGFKISSNMMVTSPRIGITKAKDEHWRYYIRENPFVSTIK